MSTIERIMAQGLGGQSIAGELHQQRAVYEESLQTARSALQKKCVEAEALRVALPANKGVKAETSVDVNDVLALAQVTLPGKGDALRRTEQEQETFRLRHGLTREPVTPPVALSALSLGLMGAIETGINAGFFQNAYMVESPAAAFLTSGLISLTNITASACAGYFIGRWKEFGTNAVDADAPEFKRVRTLAKWQFRGFLGVMAVFHATVGLVRSLESLDKVHHTLESYAALATTPEALFLVLTGGCMSVLAYRKGKHAFDDPYPDYGGHHRAVLAARDDLLDSYEDSMTQIEDRFDEAITIAEKDTKSRKQAVKKYNDIVSECLEARRELEQKVRAAESGLRAQTAQMVAAHHAARGVSDTHPDNDLDQFVSFSGYLELELPTYHNVPDVSARKSQLVKAKSAALKRLSAILHEVIHANTGESK